ncbi:MAG: sulfotransferase family 2 domain-containing protein [Halioglobus sp.]|nr:sulfotransferase family 2 domain-containing protein [Halioglobus sp.]
MHPQRALRFLHIPKTAGTSFNDCLFAQYPRAYYFRRLFVFSGDPRSDLRRLQAMPEKKRDALLLYTGHGPLNCGDESVARTPTITFLRDPVSRVVSLCQHIFEGKSPEISTRRLSKPGALDAWLDSGEPQLSNMYARALLGDLDYRIPGGTDAQLAERSIDILENSLQAFGLTENFDLSLLVFRQALGWRCMPRYRRRNTRGRERLRFTDRQLERIAELNSIDQRIYTAAVAVFQQRVAHYLGDSLPSPETLRHTLTRPSLRLAALEAARVLARRGARPDSLN